MIRPLAFVLGILLSLAPILSRGAAAPTQQWIAVSDIHFDPLANPRDVDRLIDAPAERWREIFAADGPQAFPDYGHDTNDALLESVLDAMHATVHDPAVVLVTGDFLAHHFRARFNRLARDRDDAAYDAFVDKTIAFLAMEFRAAFPRTRILPVIGNNDGYCADYASTPGSPFLARFAAAWASELVNPAAFASEFSLGGYYTQPLPAGNAEAIVLNDVLWSAKYSNACGNPHADPGADELTWLSQTLKATGDAPVWVIGHIPPGVDTFTTLQTHAAQPVPFLADRFNLPFISVLASDASHVVMSISGHTHMDGFRIIGPRAGDQSVPMLVIPAVSPVYFGNPSFTVLDVDGANAHVLDSQVFTVDNLSAMAKDPRREAQWRREYDFNSVYGRADFDAEHLWAAQDAIFNDDRVRRRYEQVYDGGSGRAPITDATWRAYWCSDVAMIATDYAACSNPTIQTQLPPHPSAPPPPTPTPSPSPSPAPSASP
ncbi:MAG TPA: metallophosphoesterase [Candidatus Baltobacteraceae bacterium]|nr:metallophosphoesterase [Candidatus Baltobacteraceae bacterium]